MKTKLFNAISKIRYLALLMLLTISVVNAWAADELVYTLDCPASSSNNTYSQTYDVTVNDIQWNAPGNQFADGEWRIGGKSLTNIVRTLYTKTAITDNITKIEIELGSMLSITCSSCSLVVSTAENGGGTQISKLEETSISENSILTFERPSGNDWSNRYYKIMFKVSVTTDKSNKYIQLKSIKFYKAGSSCTSSITPSLSYSNTSLTVGGTSSSPTITGNTGGGTVTYSSSNTDVATVNSSTGVVTAVAAGSATITASIAAKGTYCSGSATIDFTIKNPTCNVSWNVNGDNWTSGSPSTSVEGGQKVTTLPTAPTSSACDGTKVFVGWTAKKDYSDASTPPTDLFITAAGSPTITTNTIFYAVFATNATDATRITTNSSMASGNYYVFVNEQSSSSGVIGKDLSKLTTIPAESNSKITTGLDNSWLITGDATNGFVFGSAANKTMGINNASFSSASGTSYDIVDNKLNSLWKFEASNTNYMRIRNAANTTAYCVEFSSTKWVAYKSTTASYVKFKVYKLNYSNYATTCCSNLGQINGSVILTQSEGVITASIDSADLVTGASRYKFILYDNSDVKKAEKEVTGNSGTVSCTFNSSDGVEVGNTYKVSVIPLGDGSTYCAEGEESSKQSIDVPNAATWAVTFNANTSATVTGMPAALNILQSSGSGTLPSTTPSRTGWQFVGWNSSSTATTAEYAPNAAISISGDKTLYAIWKAYQVTLDAGAGSVSGSPLTATTDGTVTLPNATISCGIWEFAGWATEAVSSTTTAPSLLSSSYVPTGNITLYAVYMQPNNIYSKITTAAAFTSGDYLLVSSGKAMDNQISSKHIAGKDVTITDDKVTTTDKTIIWNVEKSSDTYTFKNSNTNKYIDIVVDGSYGQLSNTESSNGYSATFDASTGAVTLTSKNIANQQIEYYSSGSNKYFSAYSSQNQAVYLYKRGGTYNSNPSCDPLTITLNVDHGSITPIGNKYLGESFVLPEVEGVDPNCTEFIGWIEGVTFSGDGETTTPPTVIDADTTISLSEDKTYQYTAVYREKEISEQPIYIKVTLAPSDWVDSHYLIVYEDGNVAFDGSLTTLDASSNTVAVTIADGKIAYSDELAKSEFAIVVNTGDAQKRYSIKSASGYYIGIAKDDNGLSPQTSLSYAHTLSISDGNFDVTNSNGPHLRYNSASDQTRFRYFKSSTYTSQKAIQLYKKGVTEMETSFYTTSPSCEPKYRVTVNDADGGTPVADKTYEKEGTTITLKAQPSKGYEFGGWTLTKTEDSDDVSSLLDDPTAQETTFDLEDYDVTVTASYSQIMVTSITLKDGSTNVTNSTLEISTGSNKAISVEVSPSTALDRTWDYEITSGSVNVSITNVNAEANTFQVNGLTQGDAKITITAKDSSGVSAYINIEVRDILPTSITLTNYVDNNEITSLTLFKGQQARALVGYTPTPTNQNFSVVKDDDYISQVGLSQSGHYYTFSAKEVTASTDIVFKSEAKSSVTKTLQVTILPLPVDTFIDLIQDFGQETKSAIISDDKFSVNTTITAPSPANGSETTTGTCEDVHYYLLGWVPASTANALYDAGTPITKDTPGIIAAGATLTATGQTWYAVWAKEE